MLKSFFNEEPQDLLSALERRGVSRREFLKFCTLMAGVLAFPVDKASRIASALQNAPRTPIVWLEFQDCAGCTESFLRASRPTVAEIVLDVLSVNYHETIMAAAGKQAEAARASTVDAGGHIVVVEGSIPLKDGGAYCCIGGRAAVDILQEAARKAMAVIAVGSCAAFGGIPAANPNPTGAVAVDQVVQHIPVVNLPGCPLNVVNLTATVVHFLTFGSLPALDSLRRPLFAYGKRIHDNCERRAHFDAGQFVERWGDEGHRNGWCLYKMGCKGPETYHNCPTVRWNDGTNWPIGSGHGCVGCSEPNFWDRMTPFYQRLPEVPGFGVEATVDKVGLGLAAVTAAGVAAHAIGSAIRAKQKSTAPAEKSQE
ncbi:MAG: hydrogenase small subunit [Anaerolineae bacterium]